MRARAGERPAIEDLIRAYQGRIARFVIAQTGEQFEYEDLCQKIFVKMVLALPRLKTAATFEAWLFTIARNACTDYLRSRHRRRSIFLPLGPEHESVAAPAGTAPSDDGAMSRVLKRMAPAQRELITLTLKEPMTYRQMARNSKISVAALKSRLFRARKALKQMLCEGESWQGVDK